RVVCERREEQQVVLHLDVEAAAGLVRSPPPPILGNDGGGMSGGECQARDECTKNFHWVSLVDESLATVVRGRPSSWHAHLRHAPCGKFSVRRTWPPAPPSARAG